MKGSDWLLWTILKKAWHVSGASTGGGVGGGGAVGGGTRTMCGGSHWVLSRMMVWRGTRVILPKNEASIVA